MIEFHTLSIMISVHKNLDPKNMSMIGRFKKTHRYLMFARFFSNIWSCATIKWAITGTREYSNTEG